MPIKRVAPVYPQNEEMVTVSLKSTFGYGSPRVNYGPGEAVAVPAGLALALGKMPDAEVPEVRTQTVFAADVAAKAGVSQLVDALKVAGFVTAVSIRDASEGELTVVPGIGKATAAKLQNAAKELLS